MKKIFAVFFFFTVCFFSYSKDYLNFTAGIPFSIHLQNDKSPSGTYSDLFKKGVKFMKEEGYESQRAFQFDATLEYFHTFGDKNFGAGIKLGGGVGFASGEFCGISADYDTQEFVLAPGVGFFFGNSLKMQLNVYPVSFLYLNLSEGEAEKRSIGKIPDGYMLALKCGSTFSVQWGDDWQQGVEIGFDIDWLNRTKIENKHGKRGNLGYEIRVAYKFSMEI